MIRVNSCKFLVDPEELSGHSICCRNALSKQDFLARLRAVMVHTDMIPVPCDWPASRVGLAVADAERFPSQPPGWGPVLDPWGALFVTGGRFCSIAAISTLCNKSRCKVFHAHQYVCGNLFEHRFWGVVNYSISEQGGTKRTHRVVMSISTCDGARKIHSHQPTLVLLKDRVEAGRSFGISC